MKIPTILLLLSPLITTIHASSSPQFHHRSPLSSTPSFTPKHNHDNQEITAPRGGDQEGGKSSMLASIFNLINNIAGAGILTLSGGMAKGSGTGYIPAILICWILGQLSAHTFTILGKACEITGENDFMGLWGRSIGEESTYLVDSMIAILCLSCCVIYSGILGDVFTALFSLVGLPGKYNSRQSNILIITAAILFPLGLIKDLSGLAFTSLVGFASILYTVLFVVIRAIDGSYAEGGKFIIDDVITKPTFERSTMWNIGFPSLVLFSNLALSYIAHYNSPVFYRSLKNTNAKRFALMVNASFILLVGLHILIMLGGYMTFGDVCQGNILLNYHPKDVLSTLGRVATGFSILFGYPLVLSGARESFISAAKALGYPQLGFDSNHILLVLGLLVFATAVAIAVEDISLVVGIMGAGFGSLLVFVCPALIYIKAVGKQMGYDSDDYKKVKWNVGLVPFGIGVGALGVFMTLKEAGII